MPPVQGARGGAKALGALLPRLTRRAFAARGLHEAAVIIDWPLIVGAALARRSAPERLQGDGTLVVRVDGGGAAVELQHIAPVVIERVATYFGFRAVRRLGLRQGPLARAAPAPAERRSPRAPLSAPARSAVEAVEEAELRRALERLGAAVAGDEGA